MVAERFGPIALALSLGLAGCGECDLPGEHEGLPLRSCVLLPEREDVLCCRYWPRDLGAPEGEEILCSGGDLCASREPCALSACGAACLPDRSAPDTVGVCDADRACVVGQTPVCDEED